MPNAFDFPAESAEKFRKAGGAFAEMLKAQAPMLFPSEMEKISALPPQERRGMAAQEAMGLAFTPADLEKALPRNVFDKITPYLQQMEARGMLKGTGEFALKPLSEVRKAAKSGTATAATQFPSMNMYVGAELGEKSMFQNVLHELGHVDIRNVSKDEVAKILDTAKEAGIKFPEEKFIKKHWNPGKYADNKEAARAEEYFVTTLEDLSPAETKRLIQDYGAIRPKVGKEPFKPSIEAPQSAYAKGKEVFTQSKIPEVKGLHFNGMQEMPGGKPPQYVFTLTEAGKESSFVTDDISKKSLEANRDRISKKFEVVKSNIPKAGDFISFLDEAGKLQRGKVRFADKHGAEVFPEDQSLVKDKNRFSLEVPLDKIQKQTAEKSAKEATTPTLEGDKRLNKIEKEGYPNVMSTARHDVAVKSLERKLGKAGIEVDDLISATKGLSKKKKLELLKDYMGEGSELTLKALGVVE